LAASNGQPENSIATAITEVSESVTKLVHDEIELAKAEVSEKAKSLAVGVGIVAAGAVFGVFAVIFFLLTLAWVLDGIFVSGAGDLWLGFLIVFGVLLLLTLGSLLFAWRKLKVGAPTPNMAIDEARKIRATVSASGAKPDGPANA
jgi:protein-S-isoprenylcysteine O-methyltransferase Ste14